MTNFADQYQVSFREAQESQADLYEACLVISDAEIEEAALRLPQAAFASVDPEDDLPF